MKPWSVALVVMVLGTGLATACAGGTATPTTASGAGGYTSSVLVTSYPDALDASIQLALGTMKLEGTQNSVTPEQAAALLPLWKALQGGVTAQAEVNAVLTQIERTMTPEQLEAMAAMHLTMEDLAAWAEQNGVSLPPGGLMGRGQGSSEEERSAIRATIQAGGAPPGRPSGSAGPSEETGAATRATVEAGGATPPAWRAGREGWGPLSMLIPPLVELLTQRAAQ